MDRGTSSATTVSSQREKHSAAEVAAAVGRCIGRDVTLDDGLFSGGQIENFRRGWAKYIMGSPGKVGHFYERDGFDMAHSLCGHHRDVQVRWLYGIGNIPECQHCVTRLESRSRRRRAETGV